MEPIEDSRPLKRNQSNCILTILTAMVVGKGILVSTHEDGKEYPFALRHNLIDQMKILKRNSPILNRLKMRTSLKYLMQLL